MMRSRNIQHYLPLIIAVLLAVMTLGNDGVAWAQNDDESLPVAAFHTIITEGVVNIDAASDESAQIQAVRDLQSRLAVIHTVILENGDVVHPDLSWIDPDDPEVTLARLRLLDSQLALAADDDTAARLMQLQATLQELGLEKVTEINPRQASTEPREITNGGVQLLAAILKWGMMLAGAVLLVFILGNWLSGLLRGFVADAALPRRQEEGNAPITASQAREMASDMARAGDYREAVRHLYLSALFKLEETGVAPRDRSKTNRELLAEISDDGQVRQHLQPVVDTFERVWYGVIEPDDATFGEYETEINQLDRILTSHHPQSQALKSAE